jgi:hypothetical protein
MSATSVYMLLENHGLMKANGIAERYGTGESFPFQPLPIAAAKSDCGPCLVMMACCST